MSDRDDKLNKGELIDIKSLIGSADGGGFTLDDIMAEYGHPPAPPEAAEEERFNTIDLSKLPRPAAQPQTAAARGKVVAFPGVAAEREPEEEDEAEDLPPELEEELPETREEPSAPAPITPFPGKRGGLSGLVRDLNRKADDYAEHMFEEDESIDKEEVRRLERLIPGTDREELSEEEPPVRRRPPRQEPLPPDTPPQKLAWKYGKGLKWMRTRTLLLFLLTLLALAQALIPPALWTAPMDQPACQCWAATALLALGVLLAADVLLTGIARACFLRFGMDTLAALACGFTLADGTALALGETAPERLPYSLVCLAGLFCLLHGSYHKRCALRLSCRTAAASAAPYRVTLDPGLWNDRDTYSKWSGTPEGFGSQIQADDGAQRLFRRLCPLLLLAGVTFAILATVGNDRPDRLLWALSAQFTSASAFGSSLAFGRAFHKTARRLTPSGAALAGWPGIAASRKGSCVLITDWDLFPPGYVEHNGYKVMADFPVERVVAYTATLIRESGSGLAKLFHDQLRSIGGLLRRCDNLVCHEGGGLSANIRGEQVLVGSAAFMKLMEVRLPQGLNVKNAVFCAIDGQLAGIFALNYALPDTVFPALEALMLERVEPVLATRDFNLIPAMLQQRFKLAADKMAFPTIQRRRELSDPDRSHENSILTALLCREGPLPFAEAIAAAKRLRWSTQLGAWLCCACSALGMLLAAYLTSVGAYTSLSPLNLLIYMLTWLAPVWFLSGWVHRF